MMFPSKPHRSSMNTESSPHLCLLRTLNVDTISVNLRHFTVVMMDREDEIAAQREDRSW